MPFWPENLPKRPPEGAWENELFDPTVRNSPEIGPPMSRKRATTSFEQWNATLVLSTADYALLYNFWKVDCDYGGDTFQGWNWITPADVVTYRFNAPPKVTHRGKDYLNVSLSLVRMP